MTKVRLGAAFFLGVALVAVGIAVVGGWGSLEALRADATGQAWQVQPLWLAASLLAGMTALMATGWTWSVLFRAAGGRAGSREAIAAWLGSNLGRYLPGKIWQLTGITAYLRARGDSGAAGFATSLVLQAVMLATGASLGVAIGGASALGGLPRWVFVAIGLLILAMLHPRFLREVVALGARALKEPLPARMVGGRELTLVAVVSLLVWAVYGIGLWSLVHGLLPGTSLGPVEATGVFAAAYVVGYAVLIAPGGLIVRESAMAALLGSVAGVPLGAAAAVAVAARLWTTLAELAAFGVAAGAGLRSRRPPR